MFFLKKYLLQIKIAIIAVAITGVFTFGRITQKNASKIEKYKRTIETMQKAKEIDNEISSFDVNELDNRLSEWMRDSK